MSCWYVEVKHDLIKSFDILRMIKIKLHYFIITMRFKKKFSQVVTNYYS